ERWMSDAASLARRLLPTQIETVAGWKALPARRSPWRLARPQRELLAALEAAARPALLAAFGEVEQAHRAALQDTERARQVAAFAEELAEREGEQGRLAADEALANAIMLLRHRRSSFPEVRPLLAGRPQRAVAAALDRFHSKLDRDRPGLWQSLARQGAAQAMEAFRHQAAASARRLALLSQSAWRGARRDLLARIGWELPRESGLVHVERRPVLSASLGVELAPRALPLIYQRLFRPQPVDDPRFLVGREAEMAAMAELRRLWEARKPACALLVGERGSGKTSLLSRALTGVFAGVPVIRTQFRERIWRAEQMRSFLECETPLAGDERAVVVLEELERAWLRCVGGYDALRELLGRVLVTSRRLLWIVALNQSAFRLLDPALALQRYFSHRINAGAVEREHLEQAILMRHNLTGLRLHFLAPRRQSARVSRLRRWLGLQPSPQELFFDALYRESEGLFRSAFELWLKQIERGPDGVLYVRPLETPEYESLLADLSFDELLTLQALLQHGSLTVDEHGVVFGCDPKTSLERLEVLEDRELVEPDPSGAGFRVRSEAAHAVRVALHRRNLL
ncbi:MAG: hypothetical protein ACP5U2_10875, partial [Bryobacteraceae bacterium]